MDHESKQTNGDFERNLPTPHFDDEATLLSARPVIPFHKLSERNLKRRMYFGAGLVFAAGIGLLGGIFYARMGDPPELRSETQPTTAIQEELVSTSEAAPESPAESAEEPVVPEKTTTEKVERDTPKIPRPSRNPVRIADKSGSRPARTYRREAPRHRQASDDLFRIQEIFEGSSRP